MILDHIGINVSVIGPDGHNIEAVCHASER